MSAGTYSMMPVSRERSRARSRRAGGMPRSRAEPLPRGATASPSDAASLMSRLTSSIDEGRTRQRGATPSTEAAASSAAEPGTCSRPTIATRASETAGADTLTISDPGAGGQPRGGGTKALAACRVRGEELARIHDPVGIEDTTKARHEAQIGVAELQRHARGLVEAHSVLARHAAPHGEAGAQKLVVGLLGALELPGHAVVVENHRMQVAVARVKDIGDDETMTRPDGLHLAHDFGQPGARHH